MLTAVKIQWDTDGNEINLPTSVDLPAHVTEEDAADYLSDNYGFCLFGLDLIKTPAKKAKRVTADHEDEFDPTKPLPVEFPGLVILNNDDCEWVEQIGLRSLDGRLNEGAVFTRIDDNAFIIAVRGGQILHDDRHLDEMEDAKGFSHDTWNFVASPSDGQMLLVEVDEKIFETFALDKPNMIYMTTFNRHGVTRKHPGYTVVLLQIDGFGPSDIQGAIKAMKESVAKRQNLGRA